MKKDIQKYRFLLLLAVASSAFLMHTHPVVASAITPERVVELVNESRLSSGLNVVVLNERLSVAATEKVQDMFSRQYFAHTSPDGKDPWYFIEKSGYGYVYAGENLALHFFDAEAQHRAWMESPLHRKNILNEKYRDIGVAVKTDLWEGKQTTAVVQMFGALPLISLAPSPVADTKSQKPSSFAPRYEVAGESIFHQRDGAIAFSLLAQDIFFGVLVVLAVAYVTGIYILMVGIMGNQWYAFLKKTPAKFFVYLGKIG